MHRTIYDEKLREAFADELNLYIDAFLATQTDADLAGMTDTQLAAVFEQFVDDRKNGLN